MATILTCPCGQRFRAPDGTEGKRIRCPACQAINVVPAKAMAATSSASVPLAVLLSDEGAAAPNASDTYELDAKSAPPSPNTEKRPKPKKKRRRRWGWAGGFNMNDAMNSPLLGAAFGALLILGVTLLFWWELVTWERDPRAEKTKLMPGPVAAMYKLGGSKAVLMGGITLSAAIAAIGIAGAAKSQEGA